LNICISNSPPAQSRSRYRQSNHQMNLRINYIIKVGFFGPLVWPFSLYILSEIFNTDTFYGTVLLLPVAYIPILFAGVIFSIPLTLLLYCLHSLVIRFTKNTIIFKSINVIVGCLLITLLGDQLGYDFEKSEDLIWPLSACITLIGLTAFVRHNNPLPITEASL